jgi:hypothetical protein
LRVRFLILLLLILTTGGVIAQETPLPKKRIVQDSNPNTTTQTKSPAQPSGKGSQIVDDSTKNVYGPKTTLWITESDVYQNKNNYQPLDTTIIDYHRWTFVQKLNNFYQDLGNVGTALNPSFPKLRLLLEQRQGTVPIHLTLIWPNRVTSILNLLTPAFY